MFIDLIASKQRSGDKLCMAHSASMAMGTTVDDFLNFLKNISIEYKNIDTEPGFGLLELKLYCLKFGKDAIIARGNPLTIIGPAILVVHSEHYKNVLHAIYMDETGFLHDPNPDTNDGRSVLTYKVVEWYNIVSFRND